MEDELKNEFESTVEVALIGSSGGVYEVTRDGVLIFSKKQLGRFPEDGEIVKLISKQ